MLFEKSFCHTMQRGCIRCSYFKRTGISTNNVVRQCYVHRALRALMRVRVCECECLFGVYIYFDSRKTFITDRYNILIYPRVNWICHMLQPIIENVNSQQTKTFLLWHWRCRIPSTAIQPATQRNAMQCNQSINQLKNGIGDSWSG